MDNAFALVSALMDIMDHAVAPAAGACHGSRVLVVEDEAIVALDLSKRIVVLGGEVVGIASFGEQAVELARSQRPDIVLMDVRLAGGMSGSDAAVCIRQELGIASIFITAFADRRTIKECKRAEPLGYLIKPIDEHVFALTIEIALNYERMRRAREAEQFSRRRLESRYAAVLRTMPDAVVTVNEQQEIVVFNTGAERMFQRSAAEAVGEPLAILLPEGVVGAHQEHFDRFLESGAPSKMIGARRQLEAMRKDGTLFPVEVSLSLVEEDGATLATAVLSDVTARRELERQFTHAQKLEAVGRLSASIAHDFNNLLQALAANHFLLGNVVPASAADLLQECEGVVERGASLTRQLLDLSSARVEPTSSLSLRALLEQVVGVGVRLIGRGIVFDVEITGELGAIEVTAGQFEQVLLNLFINARDAMPDGGQIIVRAMRHPTLKDYAVIDVGDTGSGMSPETLAQVFDSFFTTKPKGLGTGLGLPTVKRIVEGWGGSISAASQPGQGSCFSIVLPSSEHFAVGHSVLKYYPTGSETLLLLEDAPVVRIALTRVLERHGYRVLAMGSAAELQERTYSEVRPALSICADFFSGMRAVEIETRLRATGLAVPMLVITGHTLAGSRAPERHVLQKPFSASALLQQVRNSMGSKGGSQNASGQSVQAAGLKADGSS